MNLKSGRGSFVIRMKKQKFTDFLTFPYDKATVSFTGEILFVKRVLKKRRKMLVLAIKTKTPLRKNRPVLWGRVII